MNLTDLPNFAAARVEGVRDVTSTSPTSGDAISRRLRELGFVAGEEVRIVGRGPLGGEPLLVQIGFTRFALRRAEAARIEVTPIAATVTDRGSADAVLPASPVMGQRRVA